MIFLNRDCKSNDIIAMFEKEKSMIFRKYYPDIDKGSRVL